MINIADICEKLQCADRKIKISVLELLQQKCLDPKCRTDSELLQIFDESYLYILKCYSDRFESVRDQSIHTVNKFIARLPPNDFHLVNVISTLMERMGQEETVEESEEIRLLIMQQLLNLENKFITSGNVDSLVNCYKDINRIILKALKDSYPAVQKESCCCIVAIATSINTCVFDSYAESLAKGLYGMLNHKHSHARIAAVNALGYVALHMNANGDTLPRLIMEVSPLLMDSMPLVRRECGEFGVRLLLNLRDRYSYFERLIPVVLCCLKDDTPEVEKYILPLWVKCGKQYYDENEVELSKQEIADLKLPNYPPNTIRPTIGCRGVVQRSLRILKVIISESHDWKENVRLHSLKLMYQFILHAEGSMTANFFEIYGDVARAFMDVDPAVVKEAVKVSDLMGRLLNYDDWIEHGFEGLDSKSNGYLRCFYYMYTASTGNNFQHNLRLSRVLTQPEYSQSLKSILQTYVLKVIETILDKSQQENNVSCSTELYRNCYLSTIKVMSLSLESEPELQNKASNILLKVSDFCKCDIDDLHEKFFLFALESVQNIDALLGVSSEPIILLYGFVKLVKFRPPYMIQIQQKINTVFENCAEESKIKIFSAVPIAMLDWKYTIRRPLLESCNILKELLLLVVEPHIVWKAGSNAEAMRSLAAATLCALSQGAAEESKEVLPYFAKYMSSLLEDQSVSTRHYTVKCLYNFGNIDMEYLKPIAYGCLQRLNDPSSDIRILAASVIPNLQPNLNMPIKSEHENTYEYEVWLSFIKHSFDMLYLHFDNPEERLQAAIRDTITELSKQYPKISKDSYERALAATHNCYNLQELKKQIPLI